jgi:hypothetical protein
VAINGDGDAQSAQLNAPEPGDHTVIATFLPDAGYSGNGAIFTQTVTDADVDLSLLSSDPDSDYGQGVHFTAHVGSAQAGTAAPTGYVQFSVDGVALGDAVELTGGGTAQSPSVDDLAPGDHAVTALYSGDAHFLSDTTGLTQHVQKVGTSTTLTVAPASSTYGDAVTLTATVTPAQSGIGSAVGSVDFVDGSTSLGTVALDANGKATLTRSDIGAGSHSVKAVYSGSTLFAGSTSAARTLSIAKRATSIAADPAVVKLLPLGLPLGQLRVKVSSSLGPLAGVPVVFTIGNNVAGTVTTDVNGVAQLSATSQLLQLILHGGYDVAFAGNANFEGSAAHGGIIR